MRFKKPRGRVRSGGTLGGYPDNRRKGRRWRIAALALVVCAIAAVLLADYWKNHGRIYPGVEVNGVAVGGKTPEEAQSILEEHTGGLQNIKLTGPQDFTLSSDALGVNFDVRANAQDAYDVGRRGNPLNRAYERLEATWGTVDLPLAVGYDRERLRSGLSGVFSALDTDPVEAGFKVNGTDISVTQSQTGQKVDEEKLLDDMEAGLPEGKSEYEVPVTTEEPKLTTEQAEALKPTTLLGKYRTDYRKTSDTSQERIDNLKIASGAISGKLLAPGEVFSMNDVASPLDYNKTSIIIEGKEDKDDGGGLCQVTSTLYMAANYSGLDILERHPHSAELPYIRPGFDATVWFGNGGTEPLDMKFKNTTDGYLLLQEHVEDDGYIYAEIYGRPTGTEVEMDSEPTYMGSDSAKWTTYKKVTEDGKVTFDDVFHKDTYKPLIDEHGKPIPPDSFEPAPVNP